MAKRLRVFQAKARQPRVVEDVTNLDDDIADPVADLNDQHYDSNHLHSFPLTNDYYGESEGYLQKLYKNGKLYQDMPFGEILLREWDIFLYKEQLIQLVKDFFIQEGADLVRIKVDSTRHGVSVLKSTMYKARRKAILPIAYAIVSEESSGNWSFFFKCLRHSLASAGRDDWVFMSDKMRGVEACIGNEFPKASRRICCRHLFKNFIAMEKMQKLSAEAYQYLMNIDLNLWAKFKFNPNVSCADNTNNITESWNATLGLDRVRPIIGLLKGNGKYEVVEGKTTFPIDLAQMQFMLNPYTYVNEYYSIHKYKQAYALNIQPMPDPSQWQPRETPTINPPEVKRKVGRPARKRRRNPSEQPKGIHEIYYIEV
ncbi:Glycine--tRNA ligase beta subunit [Bienertia sinuspersici]